ncbi:MAG: sugar phosphate isomerase/epimerase family protein [Christensenellales bacterium]|jgi:D-psicose/D-tagatose/L-ribulose 3-epimerase
MRFGICTDTENAALVKKAGFDFYEAKLFDVHDAEDSLFSEWLKIQDEAGIQSEAMNCMLPRNLVICGPKADLPAARAYLEKALPRSAKMGCKTIVFGSAWSRNMPEGFSDKNKAFAQIKDYLHMASDICAENDITIAIEPLGAPATNIVTFIAEGHYLLRLVNRDNVRLLADIFAMVQNHESCEEIVVYGQFMQHLHFCSHDRRFPRLNDKFDYAPFFEAVKRSGFDNRISIEATAGDDLLKDYENSMAVLRHFLCV